MIYFLVRILISFIVCSLLLDFFSFCYGKYMLKRGFRYIGHWYLALSQFSKKQLRHLCPYSPGDKCPCWNCVDYVVCSKRLR